MSEPRVHRGACLCGAVTLEVRGELPGPDACHCTKCRKFSGHVGVASDVPRDALTVHGMEHVTWYPSSPKVRRGFCRTCGASLFFDPPPHVGWIAVYLGAFDGPTHTKLRIHIFVDDKGDYYDICDGLPQNAQ